MKAARDLAVVPAFSCRLVPFCPEHKYKIDEGDERFAGTPDGAAPEY
jgi:hypothetical protein